MRRYRLTVSAVVVFSAFLVFPALAFSEVRISLKNGRDIIAESCRESKDRLICVKMGGSFEIEKRDVLDIKGITIEHAPSSEVSEKTKGQEAESGKNEAVKSAVDTEGTEKQPVEDLVKGLKPEEKERLMQINKKKTEYAAERQRLIVDRQQLQEVAERQRKINERRQLRDDVKIAGSGTQAEIDAINKRIADLEARISTFNEDVRKLNEEGRNILESSKNNR